jgi:hypothetical protein
MRLEQLHHRLLVDVCLVIKQKLVELVLELLHLLLEGGKVLLDTVLGICIF